MKQIVILRALAFPLVLLFAGCSAIERSKWNDKNMRVMVHFDNFTISEYTRAVDALVAFDRWTIVDRGPGLKAVKREQELETEVGSPDFPQRFEDREKWAQWGKLWGVGAVAVGHADCYLNPSIWNFIRERRVYKRCEQFLTLIDANSAEVLASGRAVSEGENILEDIVRRALKLSPVLNKDASDVVISEKPEELTRVKIEGKGGVGDALEGIHVPEPEWTEVVAHLNDSYPTDFSAEKYHPAVEGYAEESGARSREILLQQGYSDRPRRVTP